MVIQCPECRTRFQLAAERLPVSRKVRCSRCRQVFQAEPGAPAEAPVRQEPVAPAPLTARQDLVDKVIATAVQAPAEPAFEEEFAIEEPVAEQEFFTTAAADYTPEPATEPALDSGFDFTIFDNPPAATEVRDEQDYDKDYADGFVTELDSTDDLFAAEVDEFAAVKPSLAGDDLLAEEDEETFTAPTRRQRQRQNPLSLVTLVLLALLLALLGFTAYLMWVDGADAPIKLLQQLFAPGG